MFSVLSSEAGTRFICIVLAPIVFVLCLGQPNLLGWQGGLVISAVLLWAGFRKLR
jgi:hypothetical protein